MATQDRYMIISADTHAGGSRAQYREYLEPELRDEFDAWRDVHEPVQGPEGRPRTRNWDSASGLPRDA